MLAIIRSLSESLSVVPAKLASSPALVRLGSWGLASLVVAWVVSGWFWQLAAPDTAPHQQMAPLIDHQSAVQAVVARHLFGRASSGGDGVSGDAAGLNLRLLGAMTGSADGAGFAILAEDGKPSIAAIEGEVIRPGVTLLKILPGKVQVKFGERVETIEMTKAATTEGIVREGEHAVAPAVSEDRTTARRLDPLPRMEHLRP